MKLTTVRAAGATLYGAITKDGFIDLGSRFRATDLSNLLAQDLLEDAARYCASARPDFDFSDLTFLPVISRLDMRLFALGWAYKDHQLETGKEAPTHPNMFSKHPQSAMRGPAASFAAMAFVWSSSSSSGNTKFTSPRL